MLYRLSDLVLYKYAISNIFLQFLTYDYRFNNLEGEILLKLTSVGKKDGL